jgi:phage/conjugal plasmid C-4 type zinc finger TraR family protein
VSDETDRAQEMDEIMRNQAIAAQVAGSRIAAAMPGLHECSRCGAPINPARLKAVSNAIRCTPCQREYEEGLRR